MADQETERRRIARHLETRGPVPGDVLTIELGFTPEKFWGLINFEWFEITGKGWDLTDRGRKDGLQKG